MLNKIWEITRMISSLRRNKVKQSNTALCHKLTVFIKKNSTLNLNWGGLPSYFFTLKVHPKSHNPIRKISKFWAIILNIINLYIKSVR